MTKKCTMCKTDHWLTPNSTCTSCDTAGFYKTSKEGVNSCLKCEEKCATCSGAADNCTSCPNGASLETCNPSSVDNNTFIWTPVPIEETTKDREVSSGSRLTFRFNMSITRGSLSDISIDTYRRISNLISYRISFKQSSSSTLDDVRSSMSVSNVGSECTIDLTLASIPPNRRYTVTISNDEQDIPLDGMIHRILHTDMNREYDYGDDPDAVRSASSLGSGMGSILNGQPIKNEAAVELMLAAASSDPTGLMAKFSQFLKILSKLSYLNMNFGSRLGAFFNSSQGITGTEQKVSRDTIERFSMYTRGSFTRRSVEIRLLRSKILWKVIMYFIVNAIHIVVFILMSMKYRVYSWVLYVMYYIGKVQLIAFNMVFVDIVFSGCRVVLHSRDYVDRTVALVGLQLVVVDVVRLVNIICKDNVWRVLYSRKKKIEDAIKKNKLNKVKPKIDNNGNVERDKKEQEKRSQKPDDSTANPLGEDKDQVVEKSNKDGKRTSDMIDYNKTYSEIFLHKHESEFLSSTMTIKKEVFSTRWARLSMIIQLARISGYQSFIISCQYTNVLGIISLMMIEVGKIILTIVVYIKLKHIRFIILLIMELSQSVFLLFFMITCLIINSRTRNGKEPPIAYQSIGIYTVITSCICEYLLLLTYIFMSLYLYIRNRPVSKNVRNNIPIISYTVLSIPTPKTPEPAPVENHMNIHEDIDRPVDNSAQQQRNIKGRRIGGRRKVHQHPLIESIWPHLSSLQNINRGNMEESAPRGKGPTEKNTLHKKKDIVHRKKKIITI